MQWRNPKFTQFGTIDCEVEHQVYGWVPFTASPDDTEELGRSVFASALPVAAPYVPPPPPVPEPPSTEDVNRERDRRVNLGSTFTVTGYGPVRIAGDDTTIRNLQGLAFAAQLRLGQGDTTTLTPFRDEDNVIHQLAPAHILDLWSQGAAYVSAVFAAAWALKDNPAGIPSDYTSDTYWP